MSRLIISLEICLQRLVIRGQASQHHNRLLRIPRKLLGHLPASPAATTSSTSGFTTPALTAIFLFAFIEQSLYSNRIFLSPRIGTREKQNQCWNRAGFAY
ncbi:hypothetical protein L1887_07031 [Cichorium endivia]|nr:hypothetical protein L1887_07031 [Cichorium endivia]